MSSPNRPPITFAPTLEVSDADVHLRLVSMDELDGLAATYQGGDDALARYIGSEYRPRTEEELEPFLRHITELTRVGAFMQYFMGEGEAGGDGPLCGGVSLYGYQSWRRRDRRATLAAWTTPAHNGNDITQSIKAVFEYAGQPDVWDLEVIEANATVDDPGAEGRLKQLGFTVLSEPFEDVFGQDASGNHPLIRTWTRQL
jgi:RimJ/RimL family protein N-acetyltransferase